MLEFDQVKPNALFMTLSGEIGPEEVREALDRWRATRQSAGLVDLLIVVDGGVRLTLAALLEDLKHVPESLGAVPHTGRVALVSAPSWITAMAKIERALIPGLHLQVYPPEELPRARAWVLREIGSTEG